MRAAGRRNPGTERYPRPDFFWHAQRPKSKFGRLAIFRSPPGLAVSPRNARRPDLSIAEGISPIGFKLKKLWSPEVEVQIRNFHKISQKFRFFSKIPKKLHIFSKWPDAGRSRRVPEYPGRRARFCGRDRLFSVGRPLDSARPAGEFPNPVCSNFILKCM